MITYWQWLFKGSGAGAGIKRYFDIWLLFHIVVGAVIAWLSPVTLQQAASSILLPLAGIFVGLSFAWGGNAQALLETPEIRELTEQHAGGFEEYVYSFQSAILAILLTLILWGVTGLGIFDKIWPTANSVYLYGIVGSALFGVASLTIRECWHVVLGAQWFLLARYKIKKSK